MEKSIQENRHYPVAMLKVVMEMRKGKSHDFEEIFERIVSSMSLDRNEFRRYLFDNRAALENLAKEKGLVNQ